MLSFAVLDIGAYQTLALAGQVGVNGELQVIGASRQPSGGLHYGVLCEPAAARTAVAAALHELEQQSGQTFREVSISIACPDYQNVTIDFKCDIARRVRQADVDGLLRQAQASRLPEHHMMLHVLPVGYTLDGKFYKEPPIGVHGHKMTLIVHMICLDEAVAKNLRQLLTSCGRKVRRMFLQPLAAAQAVVTPEERELGVCLLHLGARFTELVLFTHRMLNRTLCWTLGGGTLTDDIAYVLRTSTAEADRLKLAHGCALHLMATDPQPIPVLDAGGRQGHTTNQVTLSAIIEGRMEEIFTQIREHLEREDCLHRLAAGCILTGGGSQLKGVAGLAEEVLGIPARIGRPMQFSEPSVCQPDYAVAAGLLQLASQTTTPPLLQVTN